MSDAEVWTIGRLLDWSTKWLSERGGGSPRLDAELLLGEALSAERLDLYLNFDKPCDAGELAVFKKLLVRRRRGEPVAYILQRKGFHAIDLKVGPGVLVPRPETEYLVDWVLAEVGESGPTGPVLDFCTGSAAVALALAHAWKSLEGLPPIVASDTSKEALNYARDNADNLGLAGAVSFVHGTGMAAVEDHGPFAVIASNPPYVLSKTVATLAPDVRDFEPHIALDGGADGSDVLRDIATWAPGMLRIGGVLAVELGSAVQGAMFVSLLTAAGLTSAVYAPIGPGPTGIVTARRPLAKPLTAAV